MSAFRALTVIAAVAALAVVTIGCEGAGRAREEAGEQAERAGEKAEEAGDVLGAAKQTLDVKAALMADEDIDASNIDVDTDHETRTVTLRGSVPTAAQKEEAERIARDKAEGYTVTNLLTVSTAQP